jgi:hypothetical protein
MQFILSGFTQSKGFRVFTFEGVAVDRPRTRTIFTVGADLALIRRYGIQIQELPLLCRALLDGLDDGEAAHALIFTEDKMRTCANDRAAAKDAAAAKRRPPRKPPAGNLGAAWRVQGGGEIALAATAPATGVPAFQTNNHKI